MCVFRTCIDNFSHRHVLFHSFVSLIAPGRMPISTRLEAVRHIYATSGGAFAAIQEDTSAVEVEGLMQNTSSLRQKNFKTYHPSLWGVSLRSSQRMTSEISRQRICKIERMFLPRTVGQDGAVVTWGSSVDGGDSCRVQEELKRRGVRQGMRCSFPKHSTKRIQPLWKLEDYLPLLGGAYVSFGVLSPRIALAFDRVVSKLKSLAWCRELRAKKSDHHSTSRIQSWALEGVLFYVDGRPGCASQGLEKDGFRCIQERW